MLALPRLIDALADLGGSFARFFGAEFGDGKCGRFDVQVDPVEKWPADSGTIALNLCGRAATFVFGVAKITAGAWVHGRDEHEGAGQRDFAGAARYCNVAIFKRITINSTLIATPPRRENWRFRYGNQFTRKRKFANESGSAA